MRLRRSGLLLAVMLASAAGLVSAPATANWLTKILDHAGDAGRRSATSGLHGLDPDLGRAAAALKSVPERPGFHPLAAEAGPEGHWRFVNAKGESFTAANADELKRMRDSLLPGTDGKLALYLTPDTVFAQRALLDELPGDAELFLVAPSGTHRLIREGSGAGARLLAEVRPNLRLRLDSEDVLAETLFQLGRPLQPATLRVLALETGSADALAAVPRFDPVARTALVDRIDPARLAGALRRVRSQTVILTGQIEGGALKFLDAGGGSGTVALDAVRAAARAADVNLIVVKAATAPRQPGGKNWLWQTTRVPGLDAAVRQPTFGDFLAAIGPRDVALTISGRHDAAGRVLLDVMPEDGASSALTGALTDWVDAVAGEAMAHITVAGVEADLRDQTRQDELDRRIVPGIPSAIQVGYLLALGMGLFGLGTGWAWWGRIWPPEDRAEYGSALAYGLARGVRGLLFAVLFLPLAGVPLFVRTVAIQIWRLVTAPLRAMRWMRDRLASGPG